jgi:hypothetical protein
LYRVLTDTTIYPKDEELRQILGRPEYWEVLACGHIKRKEMFSRFTSRLASDPLWKDYLFNYMNWYAILSPGRVSFVQPILNAVNEFENSLRVEIGKIPPSIWGKIEGSKKDFLMLLHMWALLIQDVRPLSEGAHESAVREMVGWAILEKIGR